MVGNRIRLGQVDSTEVNLSKYRFDNKTYLDMLYQSIRDNLLLNGYYYTLRDSFSALDLRDTYESAPAAGRYILHRGADGLHGHADGIQRGNGVACGKWWL